MKLSFIHQDWRTGKDLTYEVSIDSRGQIEIKREGVDFPLQQEGKDTSTSTKPVRSLSEHQFIDMIAQVIPEALVVRQFTTLQIEANLESSRSIVAAIRSSDEFKQVPLDELELLYKSRSKVSDFPSSMAFENKGKSGMLFDREVYLNDEELVFLPTGDAHIVVSEKVLKSIQSNLPHVSLSFSVYVPTNSQLESNDLEAKIFEIDRSYSIAKMEFQGRSVWEEFSAGPGHSVALFTQEKMEGMATALLGEIEVFFEDGIGFVGDEIRNQSKKLLGNFSIRSEFFSLNLNIDHDWGAYDFYIFETRLSYSCGYLDAIDESAVFPLIGSGQDNFANLENETWQQVGYDFKVSKTLDESGSRWDIYYKHGQDVLYCSLDSSIYHLVDVLLYIFRDKSLTLFITSEGATRNLVLQFPGSKLEGLPSNIKPESFPGVVVSIDLT